MFPPSGVSGPEWELRYTSNTGSSGSSIGSILGGSIVASVIIAVLVVGVPLIIVICVLKKRRPNDKKEK